MVRTLLEDLPGMFAETSITHNALGAAIQVAERLLVSARKGGRQREGSWRGKEAKVRGWGDSICVFSGRGE